jgi:cytoskeletal protein CcmA (bactofilin family)
MSVLTHKQLAQSIVVNSIIGEGTKFRGDFELNGLLRIDGAFEGTIESEGKVLVGRHGSAIAPFIRARAVVIGGKVKGNITASEMVTILSTGSVDGDIETPRLLAEEGVVLNGRVTVHAPAGVQHSRADVQQEIAAARKELDSSVAEFQ